MAIKNKALFLDRDGVINKKIGYVYSTQKFIWLKNVKKAIKYAYDNKYKIDLIILGSPLGLLSPKDNFFTDLKSLHLPIEFMNTGAACRTWTVLIGEGRCVCAFLKTDA